MKIRNRKLLNVLVAAFMTVLLAGSAFAFVSQGPLVFQGTANVDAELNVVIRAPGVAESTAVSAEYNLVDTHLLQFDVAFDNVGQSVTYGFMLRNEGTIPAVFTGFTSDYSNPIPGLTLGYYIAQDGDWVETYNLIGIVLQPGQQVAGKAIVSFDLVDGMGWYIDATSTITVEVEYAMAP